jgi:predicted nuclease with RNAse H fold
MRTVGVDLAASPTHTAVASVEWSTGTARLTDLVVPADDEQIRELARGADRIGIDAPFGWPDGFVDFVVAQQQGDLGRGRELDRIENRRPLAYRRTDRVVVEQGRGRPLSVSADQIAHVAFRAAGLLADLGVTDRVDGWAVEAYPAAALQEWGLTSRGYKGVARRSVLQASCDALTERAPWLDVAGHREVMMTDDNAFDAVITALIARAAAVGGTHLPDDTDRQIAAREGWIHVPHTTLSGLV